MTGGISDRDRGLGRDVVRAPKRKKKTGRQVAEKYADDMFSLYIKARDQRCVTCGTPLTLQCSHLFPGRHHSTKWRDDCAYSQCKPCHVYFHTQSQMPLIRYAQKLHGVEWVDRLRDRNHETVKNTVDEIQAVGDKYKEKTALLKGGE